MSRPSVWARVFLVGGVMGVAPAALATKVAVLLPHIDSDTKVSEGKRSKFHDTLTAGLQEAASAGTTVMSAEEVRAALRGKRELLDCQEGSCLNHAAEKLGADRLIVPQVNIKSSVGGSAYKIALSVYDATGTPLPILGTEACGDESDGCNLNKAFDSMKRASASIAAQVGAPTLPEKISKPATPEPPAPTPEMTLKDPSGADKLPGSQPAPAPAPYNKIYRYGWITAAAVGGVFIITSIPFLYYASRENETTCGAEVPRQQCKTVYTGNLGPGLGLLLGGGLASAGAFAVLFYLDHREQKRAAASRTAFLPRPLVAPLLTPTVGGAELGLVGRF